MILIEDHQDALISSFSSRPLLAPKSERFSSDSAHQKDLLGCRMLTLSRATAWWKTSKRCQQGSLAIGLMDPIGMSWDISATEWFFNVLYLHNFNQLAWKCDHQESGCTDLFSILSYMNLLKSTPCLVSACQRAALHCGTHGFNGSGSWKSDVQILVEQKITVCHKGLSVMVESIVSGPTSYICTPWKCGKPKVARFQYVQCMSTVSSSSQAHVLGKIFLSSPGDGVHLASSGSALPQIRSAPAALPVGLPDMACGS